jgi:small nuclear ribonucleoprotein E
VVEGKVRQLPHACAATVADYSAVLLPPINFIFKLLQSRATISVWLYENLGMRIEGKLRGFDEFMNLVIDDAIEVTLAKKDAPEERRKVGQILLKGDNISLIQQLQ